jgi:hypothetical protein
MSFSICWLPFTQCYECKKTKEDEDGRGI